MSLRSQLKALRKRIGRSDGECPGVRRQIEIIEVEKGQEKPPLNPPLCPLCRKNHWAPGQRIRRIVCIMPPDKTTDASGNPWPSFPGNLEGDCSQEATPEQQSV